MFSDEIDRIAGSQDGLITTEQALQALGRGRLQNWISSGKLKRVVRGVFRIAGAPTTIRTSIRAGLLLSAPDAAVSHLAAGYLNGITPEARVVPEVSTSTGSGFQHGSVKVHRSYLPRQDVTQIQGFRCTTLERTIVDLASVMTRYEIGKILDEAIVTKKLEMKAMRECLDRCGSRGRKGTKKLRELIGEREGSAGAQSRLELRFWRVMKASGLPMPIKQWKVPGTRWRIDAAWPDHRIAVELDGYNFHGRSAKKHASDSHRNNEIRLKGIFLLQFTWRTSDEEMVDAVMRTGVFTS